MISYQFFHPIPDISDRHYYLGGEMIWDPEDESEPPWYLSEYKHEETMWTSLMLLDSTIIGMAIGDISKDASEVDWVIIHRDFRGRGLCEPFMRFTMAKLIKMAPIIKLQNAAEVTGCRCYRKAALNLGLKVEMEEFSDCDTVDDVHFMYFEDTTSSGHIL